MDNAFTSFHCVLHIFLKSVTVSCNEFSSTPISFFVSKITADLLGSYVNEVTNYLTVFIDVKIFPIFLKGLIVEW